MSNSTTTFETRRSAAGYEDARTKMRTDSPFVVAGIPAYDEEKNIAKVIISVSKYVDKVIVCDDGSRDMTAEIASALGADVVRHRRNMGYGASIASLFKRAKEAGADVMVTIDGDGQHNAADLPMLTKPITDGEADIVIGSRFSEGGEGAKSVPTYRKIGIKAITKLSTKTGAGEDGLLTDSQSGLRAYSRRALELVRPGEMGMGASTEILVHASSARLKVTEVPVSISYHEDSSTHNPVVHGLDVVLSTLKLLSIKHPLLFYGIPGLLSSITALAFLWWDLSIFAESGRLVTNIALISLGTGVIGIILMAIAVMLWVLVSVIRGES
jgi:glycosyltransferase involved in cell wall biosynthesis